MDINIKAKAKWQSLTINERAIYQRDPRLI